MVKLKMHFAFLLSLMVLSLQAMNPEVQQPQPISQPKDLKALTLLKVIELNLNTETLPTELRKVIGLIRSTQGDLSKALLKATQVRGDILEVGRRFRPHKS